MPALLKETQKREGKKKVLSCNSRCYNAKRKLCSCPCNGTNHGVGLQKALENTKKMMGEGKQGMVFNEKVIAPKRPRDAKGHFIKKGSDNS